MAKIKIRKVVRQLDLDEYYDTGESEYLHVWVNPPRSLRQQHNENIAEAQAILKEMGELDETEATEEQYKALGARMLENGKAILAYWARIWSQGKDKKTHWSVDDVAELQKHCQDNDPGLWQFVTTMSVGLMNDYLNVNQKKGGPR